MGNNSFFDVKGYFNYLKNDFRNIMCALGAILITFAPFVPWSYYYLNENGKKTSDFGSLLFMPKYALIEFVGDKKGVTIMPVLGVIMILAGILLVMWHVAPFCEVVSSIKDKITIPYFPFILMAVVVLCIVLSVTNGELKSAIEYAEALMEKHSQVIKGTAQYSIGPFVAGGGVIISLVGNLLSLGKEKTWKKK